MKTKIFLLTMFCFSSFFIFAAETVCDPETKQCRIINPFSKVDECLIKICKLAERIQNTNVKQCVFLELESTRETLFSQSLMDPKSMFHTVEILHENMEEILSECQDNNLRLEIQKCLGELSEQLFSVRVKGSPGKPRRIILYS